MEAQRVVTVQASGTATGRGSGYVVASRLVLTSAHTTPEVGQRVMLFAAGEAGSVTGMVVWRGTPGGGDDAALVDVDDPAWRPRQGTVGWGRVVTNRPGIACQTWGFPAWVQRPGRAAETWQLSGTLNPGSGYVGDRYVMAITGYPPGPGGQQSPWAGLSGAALFSGDLLIGVMAVDPAGGQHANLEAVPAYMLTRHPTFRDALARYGGGDAVLEPVELQGLGDREPDTLRSPAALLRARRQVVAFRGRDQLLDQLLAWSQGSGFAAWLVHAPGGQGKTRLAQELAMRLYQQRWAHAWLGRHAPADRLGVLADAAVPLLVIVDYAETRTGQLTKVLRACARHGNDVPPLRMLLLARAAGDWWERLQASSTEAEDLLDGTPVIRLAELEPHPADRPDAYREAVAGFADALARVPGHPHRDWDRIAARLATPKLDAPGLASALTLHMTALADLLDAAEPTAQAGTGGPVEDRLLRHEYRYWATSAAAQPTLRELTETTRHDALAAAMLLGADDRDAADTLLAHLPALADQPLDCRNAVRDWIAQLYPPADARPWGSLQPDRLAERFVATRLLATPDLADPLPAAATPAQIEQLLTVYTRAARHPAVGGRLDPQLTALCIGHAGILALPAIDIATQVEAPGPLIAALRTLATDSSTDLGSLTTMANRLPLSSLNLGEWATEISQRIVEDTRRLATDDATRLPDLANWSNILSVQLGHLGRAEEGREASEESVRIFRELATARTDAFLPNLAMSLTNLSNRLGELGRYEDALTAIGEAARIRRRLAAVRTDTLRPALAADLAGSLNDLSVHLGNLGRQEDALAAVNEAVNVYRQLAAARPDAFLPELATSLINLSNHLSGLGRQEEGLAAIKEAVTIFRELATARPDAFLPQLATSLHNLGIRLDKALPEDSSAIIEEAVIRAEMAQSNPNAPLSDPATSPNSLSDQLSELTRRDVRLTVRTEAIEILRRLTKTRPDAFLPELATSLYNFSIRLALRGRREDAIAAIEEAITVFQELAKIHPDEYDDRLRQSRRRRALFLALLFKDDGGGADEPAKQDS